MQPHRHSPSTPTHGNDSRFKGGTAEGDEARGSVATGVIRHPLDSTPPVLGCEPIFSPPVSPKSSPLAPKLFPSNPPATPPHSPADLLGSAPSSPAPPFFSPAPTYALTTGVVSRKESDNDPDRDWASDAATEADEDDVDDLFAMTNGLKGGSKANSNGVSYTDRRPAQRTPQLPSSGATMAAKGTDRVHAAAAATWSSQPAPPGGPWLQDMPPSLTPPTHEEDLTGMPPLHNDDDAGVGNGLGGWEGPSGAVWEDGDGFEEGLDLDMVRDPTWGSQESCVTEAVIGGIEIVAADDVAVIKDFETQNYSGYSAERAAADDDLPPYGEVEGTGGGTAWYPRKEEDWASKIPSPPPPPRSLTPPMTVPTISSNLPSATARPTPRNPAAQLHIYKRSLNPRRVPGRPVYLLSHRWILAFEFWARSNTVDAMDPPGVVDNSSLLRRGYVEKVGLGVAGRLKEGLMQGVDFEVISSEGWEKLVGWHGLASPRHSIPRTFNPNPPHVLELFPALLPVLVLVPTTDPLSIGVPRLSALITATTTVAGILRALARRLRLDIPEKGRRARLWKMRGPTPPETRWVPSASVPPTAGAMTVHEVLGVPASGGMDGEEDGWVGLEVSRTDGGYEGDAVGMTREVGEEGSGLELAGGEVGDVDDREVVCEWDGEGVGSGSSSPNTTSGSLPASSLPGPARSSTGAILLGPPPVASTTSITADEDIASTAGSWWKTVEDEEARKVSSAGYGRKTGVSWAEREWEREREDSNLPRGALGLVNLGNTCMSNTWPLTAYFLGPRWRDDLNRDNPLGMKGEIAESYARLVRELWAEHGKLSSSQRASVTATTSSYFGGGGSSYWSSYTRAVRPSDFKSVMSKFNSTFQGYHQHDSQELLASLLDGLHEDLNRVRQKPYVTLPDDISEKTDEEAARISWDVYKARNDSVVVDMFQGQFKSKVTCTVCEGVSVTFDPFMYVAVPVVETKEETKRIIVVGKVGRGKDASRATEVSITVPKDTRIKVLADKLSQMLGWKDDESTSSHPEVMVWEEYQHKIYKVFDDFEGVTEIRDSDRIWMLECESKEDVLKRLGGVAAPKVEEKAFLEGFEADILETRKTETADEGESAPSNSDFGVPGALYDSKKTPYAGSMTGVSQSVPLFKTLTSLREISQMLKLDILRSPVKRPTVNIPGVCIVDQGSGEVKPNYGRNQPELFGSPMVMSLPAHMWVKVPRFKNSTSSDVSELGQKIAGWKIYREFVRQLQRFTEKQIAAATSEEWEGEGIQVPLDAPETGDPVASATDPMDVDGQRLSSDYIPQVRLEDQYGTLQDPPEVPYLAAASAHNGRSSSYSEFNAYGYSGGFADPLAHTKKFDDSKDSEEGFVIKPPFLEDPFISSDDIVVRPGLFSLRLVRETSEKDPSPMFNGIMADSQSKKSYGSYGYYGQKWNEFRLWKESMDWFDNGKMYSPVQNWELYQEGNEQEVAQIEALLSGSVVSDEAPEWIDYCIEFRKHDLLVSSWKPRVARELFGDRATFKQSAMTGRWTKSNFSESFPYRPLPQDPKIDYSAKREKSLTLHECLREFTKEETLGDEDTWYCPKCKNHQKVRKKMDIWRVPDQVVIHLKRFSNSGLRTYSWSRGGDKIDTLVEFPVRGLDLSQYVLSAKSSGSPENSPDSEFGATQLLESSELIYDLYAVSNHFGSMGGGHYTAYAQSAVDGHWYKFDDSSVSLTNEANVMTNSAYCLFYRRRGAQTHPAPGRFSDIPEEIPYSLTQTQTAETHVDDKMTGMEEEVPPPYTSFIGGHNGISGSWSIDSGVRSGASGTTPAVTPSASMDGTLAMSADDDLNLGASADYENEREIYARAALSPSKGKSVISSSIAPEDDSVWDEGAKGDMMERDPRAEVGGSLNM
ncbi:CSN-associated deubiquitinating enzyme Ubp12 [Gonapodya sp. JEL0774]|nr:CSN-associated deubiquitinating enzyme Ubp12 [Gonapodya sp. JEL0774]